MSVLRIAILANGFAAVLFALQPWASAQTGPGVSKKQGMRTGGMGGGQGAPMAPMGMLPGMPGGAGRNNGGLTGLLSDPAVQDELKLSDAQKNRLEKIRTGQDPSIIEMHANRRKRLEKNRPAPGVPLKKGDFARMNAMAGAGGPAEMREQLAEFEAIVLSVLDEKQTERLRQIDLQVDGVSALTRTEVAGKLNLDNAQFTDAQAAAYRLWQTKADHNAARTRLFASLWAIEPSGRIDYQALKARVEDREFQSQVEKRATS